MEYFILLNQLIKTASSKPDKVCIIEKKKSITYIQHWKNIYGYSIYLKKKGLKSGDRVVVKASQTINFLTSICSIHLSGGVFVPVERNLSKGRIKEIIQMVDAKFFIGDENISDNNKKNENFLFLDIKDIDSYIDNSGFIPDNIELPKENEIADILFTTGTTGLSKGVVITHQGNLAIAENVIDSVQLSEDEIELLPIPLNHSLGLRRYYGAILRGSSIAIMDGVIYIDDFYHMLDKYKITAIGLVPAMLAIILKFSKDRLKKYEQQLHYIQLGSASLPKKYKEELCKLLPSIRLYNTYGATEAGCTCILDFNKEKEKLFCIGRPTINTEILFVDENRNEMLTSKNHYGLLAFRGAMNMLSYWKEPELTNKILQNGIIYSNDIGYQGEDGYVYLLGRKDDVINSGGNKIAPLEIEEIASKYHKIEECACIPISDSIAGQIPKLYVVIKEGMEFQEKELFEYLNSKLEFFKVPKKIEVISELPKSYNGKILRRVLMERED